MLRLTVHQQQERVLLSVQTRDRNGHAVDASDPADATLWGGSPLLGFAGNPAGHRFPLVDVERMGGFDAILRENDVDTNPSLAAFYDYTMELANPDLDVTVTPFVLDPDNGSRTLWLYVGSEFVFSSAFFRVRTAGSFASATLDMEYWNGQEWGEFESRDDGPVIGALDGQPDQVTWAPPTDWFPRRILHQQGGAEGSRIPYPRNLFWVRFRLSGISSLVNLPTISGLWEGDQAAIADLRLWANAKNPKKVVLALASMVAHANEHLTQVPVVSRKVPATIGSGMADLGVGDYSLSIPTDVSRVSLPDPALRVFRTMAFDRNGTWGVFPVPSSGVLLRPGRYRARVMAEIPNADFRLLAAQTGHVVPPPGPSPELGSEGGSPSDPESLFDPSWQPVITAAVADFDVRSRNATARVDVQRLLSGVDAYCAWLEVDGRVVPLQNQSTATKDYARIVVIDASSGAVIIDTANSLSSSNGAPLFPQAGVAGSDADVFRYVESASGRLMQNGGQYHVTATIVRGGESFLSRMVINFLE